MMKLKMFAFVAFLSLSWLMGLAMWFSTTGWTQSCGVVFLATSAVVIATLTVHVVIDTPKMERVFGRVGMVMATIGVLPGLIFYYGIMP